MKRILLILLLVALPLTAQAMILAGILGSTGGTITYAPNYPTAVTATAGVNQITLGWTAGTVDGTHSAAYYNIYRGLTSGSETALGGYGNVSSGVIDTTATAGTLYYYKIQAQNSAGTALSVSEASATPIATLYAPNAVTALTATPGNAQNTVTWTNSAVDGSHSAATSYNLLRSTTSGAETLITSGVTSGVVDGSLTNGTGYYYKINALNSAGTTTSSEAGPFTPNTPSAEFASGTLDAGFAAITTGSGTVVSNSPTGYATFAQSVSNSASAIVYTTALPSNKIFTATFKGKIDTSGDGSIGIGIYEGTTAPVAQTSVSQDAVQRASIGLRSFDDNWIAQYKNTSAVWQRLNNTPIWQTSTAWQTGVTRNTEYQLIIASNGTSFTFTIKSGDGTTTIVTSPSVNWSSVKTLSQSLWLVTGTLANNGAAGGIGTVDYVRVQ